MAHGILAEEGQSDEQQPLSLREEVPLRRHQEEVEEVHPSAEVRKVGEDLSVERQAEVHMVLVAVAEVAAVVEGKLNPANKDLAVQVAVQGEHNYLEQGVAPFVVQEGEHKGQEGGEFVRVQVLGMAERSTGQAWVDEVVAGPEEETSNAQEVAWVQYGTQVYRAEEGPPFVDPEGEGLPAAEPEHFLALGEEGNLLLVLGFDCKALLERIPETRPVGWGRD
jgi:hypothetical protein